MLPRPAGRGDLAKPRRLDHAQANRASPTISRSASPARQRSRRQTSHAMRPIRAAIKSRIEAAHSRRHGDRHADHAMSSACIENAPADVIGRFYRRALTLTSVAGHCGAPQVTLPLGRWQGCPIGLSILGRRGSDRALLELAVRLAARMAESTPA